jgi:hypothetical protein
MSIWTEPSDCFIATGTAALIAGLAAAGASGASAAYGAHKQSEANQAATAASATSNAAALAEQQRQDAIQKQEFDQQQAALQKQWDAQQAIRAPYRQAGATALSQLGSILGMNFGSGGGGSSAGAPMPAATGPAPAGIDWTAPPDQLASSLTNYFQKAGKPATEVPYWVTQAPSLVARGKELNDPNYANKRLAAADIFGGGGASPVSSVLPPRPLAPQITPMGGNALAPSYNQVVPISAMMGAR